MSHDLILRFEPPASRQRLIQFLKRRANYSLTRSQAVYRNKDTGVHFIFDFDASMLERLAGGVGSLHFNLNYARPSFFALEADIELKALSAAFPLRIFDPQDDTLSGKPYDSEGFLGVWNDGNAFAIGAMRAQGQLSTTFPAPRAMLRAVWDWNYRFAERRRRLGASEFQSAIVLGLIDGQLSRLTLWPRNLTTQLPKVDHVVVSEGMNLADSGRDRLALWDDLIEAAARSGIETDGATLNLRDDPARPPLVQLLASLPAFDRKTTHLVAFDEVLDEEVVKAADRQTTGVQTTTLP